MKIMISWLHSIDAWDVLHETMRITWSNSAYFTLRVLK